MIRVQILQDSEVHFFSSSEFFMYLVGLTAAGRKPLLHIASSRSSDISKNFEKIFDYDVMIEFRN